MGQSFGQLFRDTALEPVVRGEAHLAAGKLNEALRQLTQDQLMGAVRRGAERVARRAGVPALTVFRHLPMADLDNLIEKLASIRRRATASLSDLSDTPESKIAEAAAESGADGVPRAPDSLRRIATSLPPKAPISSSLSALAETLEQWRAALDECCKLVDAADELPRAVRRRSMRRFALLVPVMIAGGAAVGWFGQRHVAEQRVRSALSGGACAAEQVDPTDLGRSGSALAAEVEAARAACEKQREEQARLEEERRAAQEKRRLEEQREKASNEACKRLGDHLSNGALDAEDDKLAGKHAALIRRLASDEFEPADASIDAEQLPCGGSPAGDLMRSKFAQALLRSWESWVGEHTLADGTTKLIIETKPQLESFSKVALARKVDTMADRATLSGKPPVIERAASMCKLLKALEIVTLAPCRTVIGLSGQ